MTELVEIPAEISRLHSLIQVTLVDEADKIDALERILQILKARNSVVTKSDKALNDPSLNLALSSKEVARYKNERVLFESEIQSLKYELKGMDLVLQQNAQLEKEVTRLCDELDEVTKGILYRY